MEILEIPIYDDDFVKMLVRFTINLVSLTLIIRWLYYGSTHRKEYLFTYYMIGIIVFLLCFTLKKFNLDLGMALGLFAIFGIIRYRTNTIEIKEMTYLFVVIGISVINSLANKKMSYAELIGANALVILALYLLEKVWLLDNIKTQTIEYEKIENIKPEKYEELILDLKERTGLDIQSAEIHSIDFLRDKTTMTISYKISNT